MNFNKLAIFASSLLFIYFIY